MADNNNDTIPPIRRDPEMEEEARRDWLRQNRYAGATQTLPTIPRKANMATGETALAEAPKLPPDEQQNYMPAIPRAPMTRSQQEEQQAAGLERKLHPDTTDWSRGRKFLHGLNVVGQDIATAAQPVMMANIPGTRAYNQVELAGLRHDIGPQQEREARMQREKEQSGFESRRLGIEEQKLGMLERTGQERYGTDDQGNQVVQIGYSRPGQTGTEWHNADEPLKSTAPQGTPVAGATLSGADRYSNAGPPPPQAAGTTLPSVAAPETTSAKPPTQWTYGKPPTGSLEEQFVAKYLKDHNLKGTSDDLNEARQAYALGAPVGEATARDYRAQIERALAGSGIDPASGYVVGAMTPLSVAKEKLAAAQKDATAVRVANAPIKAQQMKDERDMGYGGKPGEEKVTYMSRAEADRQGIPFEPMSKGGVEKDRGSIRQLKDIQKNVSEYEHDINMQTKPIEHYAAMQRIIKGVSPEDVEKMAFLDAAAMQDMLEQGEVAQAWQKLDPTELNIMVGFMRAKGAMIAYNRVISGSARANKEALKVDWDMLPMPYVGAKVANVAMRSMQENIDQVNSGFPDNLPGMGSAQEVREKVEGKKQVLKYNQKTGKLE